MHRMIVSVLLVTAASAQAEDFLDRAAIADGIAKVKAKVMACQANTKFGGEVKVQVTVRPNGKVTKVVPTANDKVLGGCVAAAVNAATFPPTTSGGSFSYPFVFEGSQNTKPEALGEAPTFPELPDGPAAPDSIDRANVVQVITRLRPKIRKCADKSKIGGSLKVRIKVKPDGRVATATHEGATDPKLGQCIANVLKAARFSRSQLGGVFTYPFNFGTATTGATGTPPTGTPPTGTPPPLGELDRTTISAGVAKAKGAIAACGDQIKTSGTVKVKVVVAADGKVTSASQEGTLTDLGACVVDVLTTVTFDKTANGGSFSYPFVFGAPTATSGTTGGTSFDRAAISAGVAAVKSKIADCAKVSAAKGKVQVKVTVLPNGSVGSASIVATPDTALGACVVSVLQKATFQATQHGGSFSYPFVF